MSIFRVHDKTGDFTIMSNYHLRDKNLSLKAKGLLSWMLSNKEDWDYSIAGIVACCKEGETTVNTALRELQKYGYVVITKVKPDSDNNRIHYIYDVYEKPQGIESLGVESLALESQELENQAQINTKQTKTNKINTNKDKSISKDIDTDFEFGIKKSKTKKPTLYDKCVSMIDNFTDDSILREMLVKSLQLFLENSKESGSSFYSNHFKGKLNTLKQLSDDNYIQRKIVQQTLDNGWNNFYELKVVSRKTTKRTGNASKDIERLSGDYSDKEVADESYREEIASGELF